MSIYIRGMKMPEKLNNHTIELAENDDGTRFARLSPGFDGWHHVIEVPPHGRLIDADEAYRAYGKGHFVSRAIEMLPAVIEAEEAQK